MVRRRAARCRESQVKTWLRLAAGSEPRRWTLFCCGLLPRHGPQLHSFFGGAIEEIQLRLRNDEVIRPTQLEVLRRGEAREDFLGFKLPANRSAGNDPLRTQVFDILDLEAERNGVAGHRGSGAEMLGTKADDDITDFGEVHRRRAEKSGDESVSRIVIDIGGSAELANHTFVEHHDAVAHGHGFHLIVRDVDGRGSHTAMKALELFAGGGPELSVEVGKRFVEQEYGRLADDGAGQCDALPLTSGKLARFAIEERANTQKRGRPLDFLFVQFFLYVLGLQRKGNVFVDREVRIERIALEDHSDATLTRREIVDDLAADEDFAGRRRFQPGDHPQESRFSGARGPEENQKLAFASLKVHVVDGSELSFFEYLCQIACLNDSHRALVRSFPPGKDAFVFVFGRLGGILRSFVAPRHFGEHSGNDPRLEGLVDGG